MEENRYMNYQGMVTTVTTGLARLDGVCRRIAMEEQAEELQAVAQRLKEHIFSVGIMGEFRRGKSTVINALLGQAVVPSDIVPTSATLNYVRWDTGKHAEIRFKNGEVKDVPVEELANYVTKITKESQAMAATVEDATVYYPCRFCQNGVQIVDTPGLNDDDRMTAITENVIPNLDAIIMVLIPDSPFSQSEAEFVRSKLMASDLGKLLFVVNKIDIVDEEDVPRLLRSIKEKIQLSVLEKMAAVYGADSEEYQKAKEKIGEIHLLPISARQALRGKQRDNPGLLQDSGYPEFEKVLSRMLTEERGLLELLHPVNQILSVSKTAMDTLQTRREALRIDAEEFRTIQLESIEQIQTARARKKEEVGALKAKGKTLYAELLPEAAEIYASLEEELTQFVADYPISPEDLSDSAKIEGLSESVSAAIDKKLEDTLAIYTERLLHKIKEQLGSDVDAMSSFGMELEENMSQIRQRISVQAGGSSLGDIGKSILFDVGGIYATLAVLGANIPGVGGLIAGFKEHGFKGAVAGGLSGAVIGFAAGMLCASVGIFGLPFALIAGTASTFGGKAVTNLIFGRQDAVSRKLDELRLSLTGAVTDIVEKLRQSGAMESWLKNTCEKAYAQVAGDIDREWELSLSNMENTLTQIRVDLEMNATNKEKCEKDMMEYEAEILNILDSVHTVREKLSSTMAG